MSRLTQPTATDLAMMRRALAQAALAAQAGEVPVGAVVYQGERILAEASNQRELANDPTGHAEILALRAAAQALGSWRLEGCSMAVTLEPCPMCAGAMINARLPRLIYGATDPKMGSVQTLYQLCSDPRFNHRIEIVGGVLAQECGAILQRFFQERRGKDRPPKPGTC